MVKVWIRFATIKSDIIIRYIAPKLNMATVLNTCRSDAEKNNNFDVIKLIAVSMLPGERNIKHNITPAIKCCDSHEQLDIRSTNITKVDEE